MENIKQTLEKIQQIDILLKNAYCNQQKKMPQKYINIQTSLKILNDLIQDFNKKSQSYYNQLKKTAKIQQISEQTQFHRSHTSNCVQLSQRLKQKLNQMTFRINQQQCKVNQMRKKLLSLKAQNVKKIIKIENIQSNIRLRVDKQNRQTRKQSWKKRTIQFKKNQTQQSPYYNPLQQKKNKLISQLNQQIQKRLKVKKFMDQAWFLLHQKLIQKQKKSTTKGLNGSLMFKVLENNCLKQKKPIKLNKLMIYDVLTQKYKNTKKYQEANSLSVTQQQFLKYSPLQILGIIQLTGGIEKLKQKIQKHQDSERKQIINKFIQTAQTCSD